MEHPRYQRDILTLILATLLLLTIYQPATADIGPAGNTDGIWQMDWS